MNMKPVFIPMSEDGKPAGLLAFTSQIRAQKKAEEYAKTRGRNHGVKKFLVSELK